MTEFKQLREGMLASPQIVAEDVARAKEAGVTLIINNRPDGEAADQPGGAEIEAAAHANGIAYRAIPVSSAGFSLPQIEEMQTALDSAEGTVLAYCRSGTRSTISTRSTRTAPAGISTQRVLTCTSTSARTCHSPQRP